MHKKIFQKIAAPLGNVTEIKGKPFCWKKLVLTV